MVAPGDAAPVRDLSGLESSPDSALAVTLAGVTGTPLTLERALALGMENDTGVRSAAAALDAARGTVRREKGAFDPELFVQADKSSDDSPTASPFSGADVLKTDQTQVSGGARITLPLGTELEASLNTTRLETNSSFTSLNPQINTTGVLSFRQPLLNGFGPAARQGLSAAQKALLAAEAGYRDAALATRARVEGAYWDVYAAERDYAVQILIRDRAQALLDEAQVKAQAGMVGPEQVANARVFLAEQELSLLDREEQLDRSSDDLAILIGTRPEAGTPRFRPTEAPPHDFTLIPADSVVAQAEARSYALQSTRAQVEQVRALARAAKWNALPTLDLVGSLGSNGLSGTGRDVIFGGDTLRTAIDGGFGDTWTQVRERDYPSWSVGVRVSVPIGLREGRGERDRLEAEVERARQMYVADARSLEERTRAAYRELQHGDRRLEAAREGVDASQEQVRIGLIQYRNGRTTAFELVRLGADLASAQQRYSQALVGTAKAAANLRYLTSGGYPAPPSP